MTTLPQTLFDEIERHGREAYPEECVGALIGTVAAGAARTVSDMLEGAGRPRAAEAMDPAGVRAFADAFTQQASETADGLAGGFGQVQKFPSAPQLALLLDSQRREPVEALAEFLRLTFGAMASLGRASTATTSSRMRT